jgi:hypothetical protein
MEPVQTRAPSPHAVSPPRQTVLWVIALLLAVNATALVVRPSYGPFALPLAVGDTPMAGARGIFAFTGQIDANRYGLFMMDVDTRNVWCYEYLPNTRKAKLVFARSFDYDRYLEDYNNDKDTTPDMICRLLEERRKIKERNRQTGNSSGEGGLSTTVPGLPAQEDLDPAQPTSTP